MTETRNESAAATATVVAIPSMLEGGLEARRSSHFGKSPAFALVDAATGEVTMITNNPPETGRCRAAAALLISAGAKAVVVKGIGARPLEVLSDADVTVYLDESSKTVSEAVAAFSAGTLQAIKPEEVCAHHHGEDHCS